MGMYDAMMKHVHDRAKKLDARGGGMTRLELHDIIEKLSDHDQAQREDIEALRQDRDIFSIQLQEYSKLLLKRDEEIAQLREALERIKRETQIHSSCIALDIFTLAQAALAKEGA